MEAKYEELYRNFVGSKMDYLRTRNSFNIVKAIKNIRKYTSSIERLVIFVIENNYIRTTQELANYLNNVEAFTYTKYGAYMKWNKKRANKYVESLKKKKLLKTLLINED